MERGAETFKRITDAVMTRRLAVFAAALIPAVALSGCSGCDSDQPEAVHGEASATPGAPAPPQRAPPEPRAAPRRTEPPSAEADPRLTDPDPEIRLLAVEELEPEAGGLLELIRVVESDPDPAVRAAAVEQMETAESEKALQSLLWALGDPHPRVVLAAIEALEFVGDERIVPELARYRNHPDPEVREAVEEAIAFLE